MKLGYALSSEEHTPADLVRYAQRAEEVGFDFALISDHFHPWTDTQGQSSFVWAVIGAIAQSTTRMRIGTGVTCPLIRTHPAIIAHAAATAAVMLPGRFLLGLGTGENLNEHVTGARWPELGVRAEMLEEAVGVIRRLLSGDKVSHHGRHYTVEGARLYTVPDEPVPILLAAGGRRSARLAARVSDGLIATSPEGDHVEEFSASAKPMYGKVTVCWAQDESEAKKTAAAVWPNGALEGELGQELPQPAHFEQATRWVDEQAISSSVVCGPDPEPVLEAIDRYRRSGFTHVWLHQIGPDQQGFFGFFKHEIQPRLEEVRVGADV